MFTEGNCTSVRRLEISEDGDELKSVFCPVYGEAFFIL